MTEMPDKPDRITRLVEFKRANNVKTISVALLNGF